jgi:Ca-activated chloride channel family protein
MNCPTTETLERLALGFLEDEAPVRAHLSACAPCARRMELLGAEHGALASAAKAVPLPRIRKPGRKALGRPLAWAAAALLGVVLLGWVLMPSEPARPPSASATARSSSGEAPKAQAVREAYEEMLRRERQDVTVRNSEESLEAFGRKTESSVDDLQVRTRGEAKRIKMDSAPAPAPAPEPPKPVLPPPPPGLPEPAKSPPPEEPIAAMTFKSAGINPTIATDRDTLSTFALDVDTASYAVVRNYLWRGQLPPPEAVRVEECLNYFRYLDPAPETGTFAIRLEAAPSPFDPERHLLRIGIKAKELKDSERKDVVLTFVIDVSGSMGEENRLELVKRSLAELVSKLRPADRIGIVVYGSSARDVLPSTPVSRKEEILSAIEALRTEDSTNVEDGIRRGYAMANRCFNGKATNRVVLCSDGVANNGVTDSELLLKQVRAKAVEGIYLSTLGFGMGNYNDHLMEKLADGGNGNYAYIDDFKEARKIFSEKLAGMMEVVAQDAKLQVEFDPATVAAFRLIGYENRHVAHRDFRNDRVDAGEVGAGHHVTALYELALKPDTQGRLAAVRIRYKDIALKQVVEAQESLGRAQVKALAVNGSASWRMAATVAMFAEILRESPRAKGVSWDRVLAEAERAARDLDQPEDAREFVELVKKAAALKR